MDYANTWAPFVAAGLMAPHYDPDTQLLTIQGARFKSTTAEITATPSPRTSRRKPASEQTASTALAARARS